MKQNGRNKDGRKVREEKEKTAAVEAEGVEVEMEGVEVAADGSHPILSGQESAEWNDSETVDERAGQFRSS